MFKWIDFPALGDDRGSLVALEAGKNIPFEIRRVYYIFGTKPGVSRGFHAHKKLKQVLVCVSGSCDLLLDDGRDKVVVALNAPNRGVLIGGMVWREMHNFSVDCVLLVLADSFYGESDYIRNYEEFLRGRCDK